jgi:hypothetical protein
VKLTIFYLDVFAAIAAAVVVFVVVVVVVVVVFVGDSRAKGLANRRIDNPK